MSDTKIRAAIDLLSDDSLIALVLGYQIEIADLEDQIAEIKPYLYEAVQVIRERGLEVPGVSS